MSKVLITRSKLDGLASTIAAKSGATLPLTIAQMDTAVQGIETGGNAFVVTLSYNEQTEMWEPDCTYAEAYAAYQDGKDIVFVTTEYDEWCPPVYGEYNTMFNSFCYEVAHPIVVGYDEVGLIRMNHFWDATRVYIAGSGDAWYTRDATAQPSQVAEGAVFYNANGKQVGTFDSTPSLQSKSVTYTPSETAQSATVTADSGYDGLSSVAVSVGAISSTYVGTGIERHSSADAVADEESVVFPAGYYAEQHYGDVEIGTVSNQSLSVENVGHGEYAVRATVNVTEGYVPSSTKTDSLNLTDYLQAKTVTPTESQQSVSADNGKIGLYGVTVEAIPSDYVGSGVTQRSSTDLTASGATVTVPAGYYASQASKAVASGTEGTPTATKGTVSNHAISVTPSVTNSAGYIAGGTKTGTAVSVSASELVSGTLSITSSGTKDVTNYASASVAAGGATASATKGTVSNHSVTVTPSVTRTAGYVTAGSSNGTAVTVSASELVSGTYTVGASGTHDVTNYASASVAAGGATASATKGTVSNHSVTVTPSVTRTAGYITAGTSNGNAVTVSASELVSGSQTITDNGTVNVTNLASVTVDIDFVTYHTSSSAPTSSQGSDGDIWLVTS